MKARFHVVAISSNAYMRVASFETFDDAAKAANEKPFRTFAVVVRDGNTGKRYSLAEVREILSQQVSA